MIGNLEGLVVLDLTRVLAGPFCTMMFADMGATVIKIELPQRGDDSRGFGPYQNGESAYFMNLNRNKKGVTLNLKSEMGKRLFLEMVKKADVVVENYRPGTMEKLGLGYETLKEANPGIIYGCISGFGHVGRNSKRAGYDIIGQAVGGLMSTTGWPETGPTRSGTAMADVLAGLSAAIGILAALHNKQKTGLGDKVDIALVDSVVASLEIINQIYLIEGRLPTRIGNRYESVYPYDSFHAKDGDIIIACGNNKLWALLCNLMGTPELIEDERYDTNFKRVQCHDEVKVIVEKWTTTMPAEEAVSAMLAVGIPASKINTIEDVTKDPHIAIDRQMFVDVEHPVAGKTTLTGSHIKFTEKPTLIQEPAPTLGQHNVEIYADLLGIGSEELEKMAQDGVL